MDWFHSLVMLVVWVGLGVFNLWIWQKEKAQSSLLMMVGAFAASVFGFTLLFSIGGLLSLSSWLHSFGLLAFGFGFFTLVKSKVLGNLAELKKKAAELAKPGADDASA